MAAFGLRRQPVGAKRSENRSAAATALSEGVTCSIVQPTPQSGVALRLPPQSKSFRFDIKSLLESGELFVGLGNDGQRALVGVEHGVQSLRFTEGIAGQGGR